ncbi:MAG TPA: fibronectin type III domain-containing protein, partial [Opitutus sp.]|nr:fibronectin type III domain-containing protein [Opitutus sp.]
MPRVEKTSSWPGRIVARLCSRDSAKCALLGVVVACTPGRAIELRVQWDDNSSIETGFVIERTSDGHHFTEVGSVPANVTTFVDTNVAPATAYWYRIIAHTHSDRSEASNVAG